MTHKKKQNQKNINNENVDSSKFMMNWAEDEPPQSFAGDDKTVITNENDYNKNLDLRMTSPMGGPFMHPMHDATLDNYSNDLDLIVNQPNEEKDNK